MSIRVKRNACSMIVKRITTALLVCVLCVLLASCKSSKIVDYYSDPDNYVTASGTITYVNCDEDNEVVYLGFSDLSPSFSDSCFKISGKNYELICESGLLETLTLGQQVTFMSAPKYFGDGYVMPIVWITVDDNTYLNFEEGMANLIAELS